MSIQIEVRDVTVAVKEGVSQKTGKPFKIREQAAWGWFYDMKGEKNPYPSSIRLTLEDDQPPYEPGMYVLAPTSFYADRFNQVSCRAKLMPQAVAARKAA
jgi:hypothetical protein